VRASSFAAALELVREGLLEMNQQKAFSPLYVRKRPSDGVSSVSNGAVESGNDG
jgi:segregation and condensation protein A